MKNRTKEALKRVDQAITALEHAGLNPETTKACALSVVMGALAIVTTIQDREMYDALIKHEHSPHSESNDNNIN